MRVDLQTLKNARIEILPLIDIVFLLLVFFIYAMLSMAVHRGLPVRLPASSTAGIEKEVVLSITVKQDGTIYLDKERIRLEDLEVALRSKAGEGQGVLLYADRALRYQDLFLVLDRIRLAGLTRISLQAQMEP